MRLLAISSGTEFSKPLMRSYYYLEISSYEHYKLLSLICTKSHAVIVNNYLHMSCGVRNQYCLCWCPHVCGVCGSVYAKTEMLLNRN